jgi:integration host factor subunit beta
MATITKKDLVERIAGQLHEKRGDVREILQKFLTSVIEELGKGNRLEFREFGVFEVKIRAARTAQNPKTLERVHVPAKRTVKFKAGREMRSRLDAYQRANGNGDARGIAVEVKSRQSAGAAV